VTNFGGPDIRCQRAGQGSVGWTKKGRARALASPAFPVTSGGFAWCYWIAAPPDGDEASLPPEPIDDVDCQIVPVVLVKK
jgi:hypothetical protein